MKLQGVFLVAICSLAYIQLVKGQHQPRKDCPKRCGSGNITIEYPFGISSGCYYPGNESFSITCKEDRPHVLRDIEVKNFIHSGHLRVWLNRSVTCYDEQENVTTFNHGQFTLDYLSLNAKNKFTLVGCNALALVGAIGVQNYSTGCVSVCNSPQAVNGECMGAGCCRLGVSVPSNNSYTFTTIPDRIPNQTSVYQFNPCIYAFLVEDGMFHLSPRKDLLNLRSITRFPVLLDWSIGNQTCKQAGSRRICSGNSTCADSTTRSGYICKCNKGFDGNPYLSDGCQDIDECTNPIHSHNCSGSSTCVNKIGGGFYCRCPSGYRLDTTTMRCKRNDIGWATILLGITIGFLGILLAVTCIQQRMKHRKDTELRQQFFQKNGGGMLIQRLSGAGPSNVDVKIFNEESMKEATNGYDEGRILGQGGQGTVYKGILPDNFIVAIKKARLGDSSQVEQFINEVLVLSQINHRNVVKLLGCCLETEVPLLVYEFITSGTLFDHLHGSSYDSSLTWEHRLRIAIEVAGTLAYLHSSASIPIIHRDIKTANILLDDNLTAKVADFGASRLIPMDKEQLTTMVQGTLGYLDPEYYNTGLLNEKSDVYSFGVVLMELLSGQKALCFERAQTSKHLASYFASAMKENRLLEIIDGQVMNEDSQRDIHEAARIAIKCTRLIGEERPRMKEVAAELEALRVRTKPSKHKWSDENAEEIEELLSGDILSGQGYNSSQSGYDSIKNIARLDIEAGR